LAGAADGKIPYGGLVMDANGDLFERPQGEAPVVLLAARQFGRNGGTVFEIKATNGTYASTPTTLYTSPAAVTVQPRFQPHHGCRRRPVRDHHRFHGGTATAFEIKATNGSYASTPTILGALHPPLAAPTQSPAASSWTPLVTCSA